MSEHVRDLLRRFGPMRGSRLVKLLQDEGLSAEAARQRLSRAKPPVRKFPLKLLPKNEGFYYLQDQRNRDPFWANFLRDMRESNSLYALALDGLDARGGVVPYDQFAVISGAPTKPMKRQLTSERVLNTLVDAGFIEIWSSDVDDARYVGLRDRKPYNFPKNPAELILLDAVRDWARKLGFASYNRIAIRGEEELRPIGPFLFDLAGPSWLAPLQQANRKPGFLVADVFADGTLNEHHIKYFIRKVSMLCAMKPTYKILPILIANSFTGPALTAGHAAGISLATPTTMFGRRAGAAIASLVETLKNVAAYASADSPTRIERLIIDLADIEGRSPNLRAVLFELMCGYLVRRDAISIEMGLVAQDPKTRMKAEIDIFKVTHQRESVTCIECKSKEPGGQVDEADIREWLCKIAIMREWLSADRMYREAQHRFELWTSGSFTDRALALLKDEQAKRLKAPIDWKDGEGVLQLARDGKEKKMVDAFREHFMKHPLADIAFESKRTNTPTPRPVAVSEVLDRMGPGAFGSPLLRSSEVSYGLADD